MHLSRNPISGKRKYVFGLILLSLVLVICVAFSTQERDAFDISRREVLLRRIGHELLLQSRDKTSRVLPVKKIAENEYQITFEDELGFHPDSLVNITRRLLEQDPLTADYVVKVLNSGDASVAYSFALSKDQKDDIVACSGRIQPQARYTINITFKPTGINAAQTGYLLGSLPLIALVGFIFLRTVKTRKVLPVDKQDAGIIPLGPVMFDSKNRKLLTNDSATDLTGTESRLLLIFAQSPNETIERNRLQKEIWEDEGVIVGRSLDMFISKLRKKLEIDPGIKIVVVRGKGYRLEVGG